MNIFLTNAFLPCTAIVGACQPTLIICNICCLNYIFPSQQWVSLRLSLNLINFFYPTLKCQVIYLLFNLIKLADLVFLNIAVFMYKFHNRRLPSVFDTFFTQVNERHNYNTRSSSNMFYSLPKVRTNYGLFNIRFEGPKVWNSVSENSKTLSISNFKESVKSDLVKDY